MAEWGGSGEGGWLAGRERERERASGYIGGHAPSRKTCARAGWLLPCDG